jgi:para-aminobenzoate synthetase
VRDFGVCRDLLQLYPDLPVLGVCLGHQGLAHFAGARVVPVPGALHGRTGRVRHGGEGIFRGLPADFEAIRYHSLAVEADSLPSNVQVTAVSVEDGRIMGLAFLDRPWHGVQFHPESIGTPSGAALLKNFLDLAAPSRAVPAARPPGPAETRAPVPPGSPVPFRELSWRDPAEVFSGFFTEASGTFWLDGRRPPASAASGWPVTVMGKAGAFFEFRDFSSLRDWMAGLDLDGDRAAPWAGYRGGPVGHLAYELHRDTLGTKKEPELHSGEPLSRWMLPEGYLVFDQEAARAFAAWEGEAPPGWLRTILEAWNEPPVPSAVSASALPPFQEWEPLLSETEYKERVLSLQDSIARGETYEACLTHAFSARSPADARAVFRRLRERNPAPYAAWLAFPDVRILSASPELFLEISPAGVLRGRPIKGTRPRGKSAAEDAALREGLRGSVKDGAENRMIVDLTRHDFSRVCAPGSVEVPSFLEVEAHPAVFQMVSEVRGALAAGKTALDAVEACFPGGSMTGAPKERTVELLEKLEAGPRGVYSGALGWFTRGGALTLSMVIRTLENRGDRWRVGCGGAVLADSDPEAEWREAVLKARSVIDAAG